MANVIASHMLEKAQALQTASLVLGTVIGLYMSSSHQKIEDMIFLMDELHRPVALLSDELNTILRQELAS
jgi:hypothetical protein